jgi:exodeoxyribonuclease III
MKVLSWNINSLKIRYQQLIQIIIEHAPDVISLQETKTQDDNFPESLLKDQGYQSIFMGQKTFNGVAILTRLSFENINYNIPNFEDDQKRFLSLDIHYQNKKIKIMNGYFPNGQSLDSDKFIYKKKWILALISYIKDNQSDSLLMGDFNIAPNDIDCHEPEKWTNTVLTSNEERKLFNEIISINYIDTYRKLNPNEPGYTWWDYRMAAFRRNLGLRIDHILASNSLVPYIKKFDILKEYRKLERPSDHAPILLTMSF